MPPRKSQPIRGERQAFAMPVGADGLQVKTWEDMTKEPAGRLLELAGNNIGPHSDIVERAEKLVVLLNKVSSRNSLRGLSYGLRKRQYKKEIWKKYLDGTPFVRERSALKAERLDDEITEDLLVVAGWNSLKGKGLLTRGEVRSKIEQNDEDFEHAYGIKLRINPERNRYRAALLNQLPEDHPLRQPKPDSDEQEAA